MATPEEIDHALISRCQRGEAGALNQLITRFKLPLFNYLLRLTGNRSDAEDLFQETLIKVWRHLPRYNHQNRFGSWLFGIAHNVAIDSMRKNKVRALLSYTAELPEYASPERPDSQLVVNEVQHEIEKVLQCLPDKQRQVFLLRQHSEMSFKEIATLLGQPLNTVLGHMHYAVSKLRKVLSEKNVL